MDGILYHRTNGYVVFGDDGFISSRLGCKTRCRNTKGLFICVSWKDGSDSWVYLKDLKESNQVKLGEYSVANKLVSGNKFSL